MMVSQRTSLLILGERKALAWVLRTGQMAFRAHRADIAETLTTDDRLLLYSTRGCFHNPVLDRGRVFGEAMVAAPANPAEVEVAGMRFDLLLPLRIVSLAPFRSGVELGPLVPQLEVFPDPRSWSARLRTTLLRLPEKDATLLLDRLRSCAQHPAEVSRQYFERAVGPRIG